jgi:hypothetical protein
MQIRFREGEKVILPSGAQATVSRRHQFVGVSWGGEYDVMTGEPGTLGCGPWLYHQDQLEPAREVGEQPVVAA